MERCGRPIDWGLALSLFDSSKYVLSLWNHTIPAYTIISSRSTLNPSLCSLFCVDHLIAADTAR